MNSLPLITEDQAIQLYYEANPEYCMTREMMMGCTEEGGPLNFAVRGWPPVATGHLTAGAMHVTAAPRLQVGPWTTGAPQASLVLRAWGKLHIGAARFSARWGADAPRVGLQAEGTRYVVRETAQRYPTLAAFYGEGVFDVEIDKAGTLTFRDLSSAEVINCGDLRGAR